MAAITAIDYGIDYITVSVTDMSTTAAYIEYYLDMVLQDGHDLNGTSDTYTYTGLSPGTRYKCSAVVYKPDMEVLPFAKNYVYQTTDSDRPANWAWETSGILKGSEINRITVDGRTYPSPLTADEWLAFMNRVKEFYDYVGDTFNSTYWYRAVNGVETGLPMTAMQANAARYLVSQLPMDTSQAPLPAEVSPGSTVTAWFFNGLKNALNTIE